MHYCSIHHHHHDSREILPKGCYLGFGKKIPKLHKIGIDFLSISSSSRFLFLRACNKLIKWQKKIRYSESGKCFGILMTKAWQLKNNNLKCK